MAASLDVTTGARVKSFIADKSGAASVQGMDSTKLSAWCSAVSSAIERYCGRRLLKTDRTEQFNVRRNSAALWLNAYPIEIGDPTPVFKLWEDLDREFTADSTIIASDLYYVDRNRGSVLYDGRFAGRAGSVQVQWTGGLGTDTDDLEANEPSLVYAANLWVSELWDRRETMTRTQRSGGSVGRGGGDSFLSLDMPPPFVRSLLDDYRAVRMGAPI